MMDDEYTIADISLLGWVRNLIGFYGARDLVEFDAGRSGEPDEGRSEAHAGGERCRNHELFGPQGIHDALHGRASETHAECNLTKA